MMILIDEAERLAADRRPPLVRELAAAFGLDPHLAGVGTFEQPGNMQQRRFARARWCYQGDDLTLRHRQVGTGQDAQFAAPLAEAAGYAAECQDRFTHSAAPRPDRGGPHARTD